MKIIVGILFIVLTSVSCKDKPVDNAIQALYKNIDIQGAKKLIATNPDIVILDVRTPNETKDGVIANAIKIDFRNSNFEVEINKLDKSKSYLVYCKSGGRSASACEKMNAAGFPNLTNMLGGYSSWNLEK